MTLALTVDIEHLVGSYLRTHADIAALNTRILGQTPPKEQRTTSWVRVTKLDAPQVNQPDYLTEFMVQFDCYAGAVGLDGSQQKEANLLARTVRAVLGTLPGTHVEGTVTGVKVLGGPRSLDTDFEPARERAILTALIHAHA